MSIKAQQSLQKTPRNHYFSYLQKCSKISYEDKNILKQMIHQKQSSIIKHFNKYQKDKNLDRLQLELKKIIVNCKRDKKNRTANGMRNKYRIHSQGCQLIITNRNSIQNSLEKHQKLKNIINFDVSQLIKRLKAQKNKPLTAPTKQSQNCLKYIKNKSHNCSISKFKLMPSIQQQSSLENILEPSSYTPQIKKQQHKQPLKSPQQHINKVQNINKINYLSTKRIQSKIIIPKSKSKSKANKQNNINVQNWIIVDHKKGIYNFKNQNRQIEFKIMDDDERYIQKNMNRNLSQRIFQKQIKNNVYDNIQTDRFGQRVNLRRKYYQRLFTLEGESRDRENGKDGPFYRKIKQIIEDDNY